MRIRQIELNGFKSFMERTVLELPPGVTAIVGPNGCGKSNVVDAIRWVLGEQSPKQLRGSAMEDVVFNGNAAFGPLGMAEVSLLLAREEADMPGEARGGGADDLDDDVMHGLPSGLAHASEIVVTRRYFRSGESEYFINQSPCRLRDITELFLGTGVGTRAYAIIEQGRVDQLLNAKPEDLRLFLEEAAGTTRFRSRKLAAERKMERTRENLVRVRDMLHELERQMASLERQARRAEEYRRLKAELRELDLVVAANRYDVWARELAQLHDELANLQSRETELQTQMESLRGAVSDARAVQRTQEERLRQVESDITAQRLALADANARAQSCGERDRELSVRRDGCEEELAGLLQRRHALEEGLGALREDGERLALEQRTIQAELEETRQVRARLLVAGAPLERTVEEAKDALVDSVSEQARLGNLAAALRNRRDDIDTRRQRLEDEQETLADRLRANARDGDSIRSRIEELDQTLVALRAERSTAAGSLEELRLLEEARNGDVTSLKAEAMHVASRSDSLRELQERHEGCARGVATLSGRERAAGAVQLVARILRVPAEYERAVAVAMGSRLTQLIVGDMEAAVEEIAWLTASGGGSATLVPRACDQRRAPVARAGARLIERIAVDSEYRALAEALLGEVLLAEDLPHAIELWRAAGCAATVVTLRGEAIDAVGAVTGGSEPPIEEVLLARERERREMDDRLRVLRARIDADLHALEKLRSVLRSTAARIEAIDQQVQVLQLERVATEKDRERVDGERVRIAAELEALALQAGGLAGEGGQLAEELEGVEPRLVAAELAVAERRARLAAEQEAVSAWRRDYMAAEQQRTELAVADAGVGERLRAVRGEMERAEAALSEVDERARRYRVQLADAGRLLEAACTAGLAAQAEARAAVDTQAHLEEERSGLLKAIAAARALLSADDAVEQRVREALDDVRERRRVLDIGSAERRMEIEHLEGQLTERYGLALSALSDVPREGDEGTGERSRRVEAVRLRLERLGDVNPGAVEELGSLRERHEFMSRQREDLERSLEDLRRTIGKLVRTSRQRFEETFVAANEKLAEVFPKLFPGGVAQLQMTVPGEDGGEPGVEIVVQPAGKKLQSLMLLSGGEKALTAVALILSLFLIRPTPFCLLDEVDAPLDEANIGRFNQVIRDMAGSSQFVLITHNRRTMEVADTLYGITMEQPGVSKVVSVRLREAA